MRTKYRNPPITELVIAAYFEGDLQGFRAEHVGLFWSQIEQEFPNVSQNVPTGEISPDVEGEIFPMPRFWFFGREDEYLIQIQRSAFILNWRKRGGRYPHYDVVKSKFDEYIGKFGEFCKERLSIDDLSFSKLELTYVNIVEDEEYFKSFSDAGNVVPQYQPILLSDCGAPSHFNVKYEYEMEPDLSLVIALQSRQNAETKQDALYFELRAYVVINKNSSVTASQWFDRAHDAIGSAFNSLTNRDVQEKYWKWEDRQDEFCGSE